MDWHCRERPTAATRRRPRAGAALPAPAAARAAACVARLFVADGLRGGRRARVAYLAAVGAIGLTAASDRTIAVLSVSTLAGYLAMALDGPR